MSVIGHGVEICTSTTRPNTPALGTIIYQTDTDEYLKYVNYGGADRWMQADIKANRRLNINGDMSVWQRGTGPVTTNGQYLADRYQCYNTNTYSRSSDTPSGMGFPYSISYGNSSAAYPLIQHKLEAIDSTKLVGKRLTLSFWAKNVSGTVGIYADFLHAGAADNWNTSTNWDSKIGAAIVPTNTWTYYSFTSNIVPANGANGVGFYIPRNNGAATTLVTGVQLEVGTAPSEFEFKDYSEELAKCQRYFYYVKRYTSNSPTLFRFNYGGGVYDNYYYGTFTLPVSPRITSGCSFFDIDAGTRLHKPYVRWDTPNESGIEPLPGNDINYQINIRPSVNDGASYYGMFMYGLGIVYNGEL